MLSPAYINYHCRDDRGRSPAIDCRRPGEVFALRWSHVLLNGGHSDLIQIVAGKSKSARRVVPMTPRVSALLRARHQAAGSPEDGWISPAPNKPEEYITDGFTKFQHRKALDDSKVTDFVPYVLRHTALTRLGEAAGGDVFVLARIAGHSSITISQKEDPGSRKAASC